MGRMAQGMKRVLKFIAFGLAGLVAMLGLYVAGTAIALRGSLPQLDGTIEVQGASAPVHIVRDTDGVPHISAQSRNDALFGLGFVHGQDRLWQMEFQRRTIQGRLSEVAGSATLVADTYLRTLGLYRAAEQAVANVSPDARSALEAYAAGVNAARPRGGKPLPPEFFMLGVEAEPWRTADSIAVLKGLAVQLSANAFQEIFRLQLLKQLGPDKAAAFNAPLPKEVVDAYRAYAPSDPVKFADALKAIEAIAPSMERSGASNNWVVGGARTVSGKPLLANDPHLPLSVPAIWYLAHLSWPGGQAIGGTIPGIPAVIAGRTDHLAWGMTTTGADTQDLYWEKIDPEDPDSYFSSTRTTAKFAERKETIKVRLGADKTITIRNTRHGPVLPTDEPRLKALVPDGYALALAWPALDPEDKTIETALAIFTHADVSPASLERGFSTYRAPIQSFVLANNQGDIGLVLPGTIPMRRADNPVRGLLPGDGRDPRFDWKGMIPAAEGPRWWGRESDMFVTANNNVVPKDYPHAVALDFDPEHRARRIKTLLEAQPKHNVASFRRMQLDTGERFAMDVLPGMLALAKPASARAAFAHAMLKTWDRHMQAERGEPLIFAAWMRAFTKALTADELGELFDRLWTDRPDFIAAVVAGDKAAARFCDDIKTADRSETCGEVLSASLTDALAELSDTYGQDMAAWRWGAAHQATFSHTPFGFLPVLRGVFGLREPMSGGNSAIQRAAYRYSNREPYAAVHGSGYRAVYDLAEPDKSIFMIATGQSGNVYSPHYGDLAPRWAKGEYLQMTTDAAEIERRAASKLVLQPSSSDKAR
jgi:penicillin G amidase